MADHHTEELPIQLDCFLMTWGINEPDRATGAKHHAPVAINEKVDPRAERGWVPSHKSEDPPF